jgi:hypothetical protein
MRLTRALQALLLVAVVGCGTTGLAGQPDVTETTDTHDIIPDILEATDPTFEDPPIPCEEEIAALADELGGSDSVACSVVVRLDYYSYELLGYEIICGVHTSVTETDARDVAVSETCISDHDSAELLLYPGGTRFGYCLYEAPTDFGCVAVICSNTGQLLFGASIVWAGTGNIEWPSVWRDPNELGSDCYIPGHLDSTLVRDLVFEVDLTIEEFGPAIDEVGLTAIPAAFERASGEIYNSLVLRYPRSVGVFNPETAEWIVIVNGGVPR